MELICMKHQRVIKILFLNSFIFSKKLKVQSEFTCNLKYVTYEKSCVSSILTIQNQKPVINFKTRYFKD